jgi:hypothetical protein
MAYFSYFPKIEYDVTGTGSNTVMTNLTKRIRLRDMLQEYGYLDNHDNLDFEDLEYNSELDNYLYKELGYDKLETFVNGLFITPYATISVREYFATAFEDCLLKDPSYVRKISPMAYIKIESLLKREV